MTKRTDPKKETCPPLMKNRETEKPTDRLPETKCLTGETVDRRRLIDRTAEVVEIKETAREITTGTREISPGTSLTGVTGVSSSQRGQRRRGGTRIMCGTQTLNSTMNKAIEPTPVSLSGFFDSAD